MLILAVSACDGEETLSKSAPTEEGLAPSATRGLQNRPGQATEILVKLRETPDRVASIRRHSTLGSLRDVAPVFRGGKNRISSRALLRRSRRNPSVTVPSLDRIYKMRLSPTADSNAILAELRADTNVVYAEVNGLYRALAAPNDTYYSSSGAYGQSYRDMWGLVKINAEAAWGVVTGSGVVVAVIDSGADLHHPDLSANIWINPIEDLNSNGVVDATDQDSNSVIDDRDSLCPGMANGELNCMDEDGNGIIDDLWGANTNTVSGYAVNEIRDDAGHGTHVSGTITAVGNNSTGIIGVAYNAQVMAVKALNEDGVGFGSDIADAIAYAADEGADVINMSLGGPADSTMQAGVEYAYSQGVVIVAAAGNENKNVSSSFPAAYPEVIAVASTDINDERSEFSNFGSLLSVSAPGGGDGTAIGFLSFWNILSLCANGTPTSSFDYELIIPVQVVACDDTGQYIRFVGTSMAAPHVAGVAALVLSKNNLLTNDEVRYVMEGSADDIEDPNGFDTESGYGRVNAHQAVLLADTPPSSSPPINESPVIDPLSDHTVEEGSLLSFVVTASDPNANPLTIDATNVPTGAVYDSSTQTLSWTPATGDAGAYVVTFTADDGVLTDSANTTITVTAAVDDPTPEEEPEEDDSGGGCATNEGHIFQFLALIVGALGQRFRARSVS